MIYLLTIFSFILIVGIFTISYLLLKIHEQKILKNERIKLLSENKFVNSNSYIFQFLNELYRESYSHYFTYCIGHFFSMLLNIYSVLFSVTSLSMLTINNISENHISEYSQIISLFSTFFVITLVFARLEERSTNQLFLWRRCENVIVDILTLLSKNDNSKKCKREIYSIISSYHDK